MKKRIFALALALCMMLSVMPTSFAGNGFLTLDNGEQAPSAPSGILTDDSKAAPQSGVLTGASKYYRDGILYNTGNQSGASYSLPSGTLTSGNTTTFDLSGGNSGGQTSRAAIPGYDTLDEGGVGTAVQELENTELKGNTTIAGAAVSEISGKVNGINMSKRIEENPNGTYTITLNASTDSRNVTVPAPHNIVLVLDASESMQKNTTSNGVTKTNAAWLEDAVKNFLDSVPAGSNVAIVGYGDSAYCHTGTGINNALRPVDTELSQLKEAAEAVRVATINESYNSKHGKYTNTGLKMATEILQATTSTLTPIVILFTDGVPTTDVTQNTWTGGYDIAQEALHWATILKSKDASVELDYSDSFYGNSKKFTEEDFAGHLQGCSADVYCVLVNIPARNTITSCGRHTSFGRCNRCMANEFLWRASSARPDSSDYGEEWWYNYTDDRTHNTKYYLTGDITGVEDMFGKIEVETGLDLGIVTVKDVLPAYLEVVNSYGGQTSTGTDGKTTVSWSSELDPGHSVSKTLTVRFKSGFLGGHSVPTNDAASGIYVKDANNNETLAAAFGIPTVNVEVPGITVTATNKNIYLSQDLSAKALMYGVKATIVGTGSTIDPSVPNFGLESWQTAYTKSIAFTTAAKNGLTDDTTFTVTCTVTPNDAETPIYQPKTANGNANITVFKPEITFNDTTVYLGTEADYRDNHNDNCVKWVDSNDKTASNMTGIRPSVAVKYDRPADIFEDCTPVKVTEVKLGSSTTDYQSYATFQNDDAQSDGAQFTVHVLTPTVSMSDQVIYLSQSVQNTEATVTWEAKCEHNKSTTGQPAVQAVFQQKSSSDYYTEVSPDSCKEYTAYVAIGNTVFTSFNCDFKVHVLVPTVSATGFSMHLGTSVDLKTVAGVSETWACADSITETTGNRTAPTVGYDFYIGVTKLDAVNAYAPDDDVPAVTAVLKIGTNDYHKQYSKEFAIDVIMPQFTVNQKEVWADYTADVNLDDHYGHTLKEVKWDKATYTLVTKEPSVVCTFEYRVNEGNGKWTTANQVYKQGTQDTLISVTKATWAYATGKTYVATAVNGKLTVSDGFDFKIHVNKFDLTIHKTWNGADVYKQDAIFTVSGGLGEFQVVLPAGQESIVIKGLLCGQDYTVTEDSNWTWRWKATAEQSVNCESCKNDGHHDVNPANPHDPNTPDKHGSNAITFENILNRLKTKWFDFCKLVMENIFGVGSFERRGN